MRVDQLVVGCLLALSVVAAQACVGDEAGVAPVDTTPEAGAGVDAASPQQDASTEPVKCRTDQLLCDNACVDVSPQHCGSCTTVCPASAPLCASGTGTTPGCVAACKAGEAKCGDQCVDTTTNPSNCGSCGNKCPTPLNGLATCAGSTCDFTCKTNFHACGAECSANDDVMKCGPTCKVCPAPANGTAVCDGACKFTCGGGLTVCATQGICANTTNDKNNCGACGKICAVSPSCTAGICPVIYGNSTPLNGEQTAVTVSEFTAIRFDTTVPITVTKLGTYIKAFSTQYSIWLALYGNNGGHPGALLGSATVLVTSTGVKELSLAAPVTIPAGTYFVGATQSAFAAYGLNSGAGTYEYVKNPPTGQPWNAAAAPSPAPATATFTGSLNLYVVGKE